jgi:hypothetical protein
MCNIVFSRKEVVFQQSASESTEYGSSTAVCGQVGKDDAGKNFVLPKTNYIAASLIVVPAKAGIQLTNTG